jgi:hypothetical protein
VQPEVAKRLAVEEGSRRGRDDDLASVRERSDACPAMEVDADVTLRGTNGRARVQAHADTDRTAGERLGGDARRLRGALRGGERDEKRVTLRVDLDAAVNPEGLPQGAAVVRERLGIRGRSHGVEQARGALDVREEERDRAGGKVCPHRTRE